MRRLTISAAACTLAFAGAASAGPLVANGSFEQGPANLGSFAGWTTVLGDDGTFVDSDGQTGTHYGQATNGVWSAFFGSTQADGGASISQTFSTITGQTYVLGFDLANDNGGGTASDAFAATVDGTNLYSVTGLAAQDYVHLVYTFVGAGPMTTLAFSGYNDNGYVQLDDVTVTAVPEPATLALIGAGILAIALPRRRSRRRG